MSLAILTKYNILLLMQLYVQLTTSMVAIGYFYHFVSPLQYGDTPLHLAKRNGHSAVVSLLEKSDDTSKLRVHIFDCHIQENNKCTNNCYSKFLYFIIYVIAPEIINWMYTWNHYLHISLLFSGSAGSEELPGSNIDKTEEPKPSSM